MCRIIPARAGFTTTGRTSPLTGWDHPRSRGVYSSLGVTITEEAGSSPLARGLRRRAVFVDRDPGIIPARAGFTVYKNGIKKTAEDHPRSRGVYDPPHT